MNTFDTIIVGGGPAGSACAWRLKKLGREVVILDKKSFPRPKVCAGWITPKVFDILDIKPDAYPYSLTRINRIVFSLLGIKFPVKTYQYAVRRYEFDAWMVSRSKVRVMNHTVKNIARTQTGFIIDDRYRAQRVVGAGGTHCPVKKHLFMSPSPKNETRQIAAVEKEYRYSCRDMNCYIWFFDRGLPGYAWYLPKKNGWLNIGVGGKCLTLKNRGKTIMDHWHYFLDKLYRRSLIDTIPENPRGHVYSIFQKKQRRQMGNAFLVGDSAGLSTLDMGEGIHAAISSGLMAAETIAGIRKFTPCSLPKFSLPDILFSKR